jgi:hypothetical protein
MLFTFQTIPRKDRRDKGKAFPPVRARFFSGGSKVFGDYILDARRSIPRLPNGVTGKCLNLWYNILS